MNKNETIADIRKEAEARFRELLEKHVDSLGHIQAMQQFNHIFDRIEAVQKREQSQSWHHREMEELVLRHEKELADARMSSGNAAKIQEALTYLEHVGQVKDGRVHFADIVNVGNAKACLKDALSLPISIRTVRWDNKKGKTMPEYIKYIRCHIVKAAPMTRGCYNELRGWTIPANENPADEGYHIVSPDGYESWCPKAQFEAAGRPIDGMTFGQAIDVCRYKGAKIQRANWNGEGQFVEYKVVEVCYSEESKLVQSHAFVFHFVNRKTGETGIQVGWLASQADMAASDWRIVE